VTWRDIKDRPLTTSAVSSSLDSLASQVSSNKDFSPLGLASFSCSIDIHKYSETTGSSILHCRTLLLFSIETTDFFLGSLGEENFEIPWVLE
jgi:hypothetical protein